MNQNQPVNAARKSAKPKRAMPKHAVQRHATPKHAMPKEGAGASSYVGRVGALAGPDRTIAPSELEVALLDRAGTRRCFRRLPDDEVGTLLGSGV